MKMLNNTILSGLILVFILLAACDPGSQRRLDKETLQREKRLRSPRRLKEAEVVEAALVQGQIIWEKLQQSQTDGSACCPAILPDTLNALESQHQASISCYALEEHLPAGTGDLEKQLVEAYQYNLEQNVPLEANLQPDGKEHFIYTAPASNGGATKNPCAIWSIRLSRKQVVLGM